jgi:alkanesulfonate monooxygenase
MHLADLRVFTEPQQGATYDDQLAVARHAERLGYGAFFRSDHYLKMASVSGLPGPTDSWVVLAGLARETTSIRLGTLVSSATFRTPGQLAMIVAGVDQMSGGRVELGLGAGWYEAEHRSYGIPFPDVATRFDNLEEQLAIISGLWSTPPGETFTYEGAIWQLQDSPALPKPVQPDGPPIIVGGKGPSRTPALAARYADEFNTFSDLLLFRDQCTRVAAACEAIDRDPVSMTFSAAVVLCCGADEEEYRRRAAAIGRDPDELRGSSAAGTPNEVAARLREWNAAGADRIYLQMLDLADLEHLDLVAEQVAPDLD